MDIVRKAVEGVNAIHDRVISFQLRRFHSGEGLSPYFADCSSDPCDLRPVLDMVEKRLEEVDEEFGEDVIKVVDVAERHDIVAHSAFSLMLADRLKKNGRKFSYGFEFPYDSYNMEAKKHSDIKMPENIAEQDVSGRISLASVLNNYSFNYTPYIRDLSLSFCFETGVSAVFCDAARRDSVYFNMDDPENKKLLEGTEIKKDTRLDDVSGMAGRNRIKVSRALSHARATNNNLILNQSGAIHVLGNRYTRQCCETSETYYFEENGACVIPVFMNAAIAGDGVNIIPYEARDRVSSAVIANGMYQRLSARDYVTFSPERDRELARRIFKASGFDFSEFEKRDGKFYEQAFVDGVNDLINDNAPKGQTSACWKMAPG